MVVNKKILVIDDEDDIRLFVGTSLQRAGFETSEALDGLEGLRRFYSDRPDLVVLDIAIKATQFRFPHKYVSYGASGYS